MSKRRERLHFMQLEPGARATAPVRDWLAALLEPDFNSLVGDAQLALTELVNNALVHASGSTVDVEVRIDDRELEVSVRDRSFAKPKLLKPTAQSSSGRGIFIVDHVADEWGVTEEPSGKQVWFRLRRAS